MSPATTEERPGAASYGAALYLAVIQIAFVTTWTVYVVFLPGLVKAAGLPAHVGVWLVLLDQVIFALMDTAMGFAADLLERLYGRLAPLIVGLTLVSCLAFLALPWLVGAEVIPAAARPILLVGLIVVWSVTSSVLRAPPIVLLGKHAAQPRQPWMVALYLAGVGIGGAVAPYLGGVMTGHDPRLPFTLSSLVLLLTVFGLVLIEHLQRGRAASSAPAPSPPPRPDWWLLTLALVVGGGLMAVGFQGHFFLNSKALYLQFAEPSDLGHLMPLFWVGFNLALFPAAALARRRPELVTAIGGGVGALGALVALGAPNLPLLIGAQCVAGAGWGAAFMAGISAALSIGRGGREGLTLGLWFSALAVAAVGRVVVVVSGAPKVEAVSQAVSLLAGVLWGLGAIPLLALAGAAWWAGRARR